MTQEEIKKEIDRIRYYIKNKKVFSYYKMKKVKMLDIPYEERIRNTPYNKAITKLDELCSLWIKSEG